MNRSETASHCSQLYSQGLPGTGSRSCRRTSSSGSHGRRPGAARSHCTSSASRMARRLGKSSSSVSGSMSCGRTNSRNPLRDSAIEGGRISLGSKRQCNSISLRPFQCSSESSPYYFLFLKTIAGVGIRTAPRLRWSKASRGAASPPPSPGWPGSCGRSPTGRHSLRAPVCDCKEQQGLSVLGSARGFRASELFTMFTQLPPKAFCIEHCTQYPTFPKQKAAAKKTALRGLHLYPFCAGSRRC